jgi:glycosyltransferase involved in cell wall biosynthesis
VTGTFEYGGIGEVVYNSARELGKRDRVTITAISFRRKAPSNVQIRKFSFKLLSEINEYDVIHIHGHTALMAPLFFTNSVPKVITHHGFIPPQYLSFNARVKETILKNIFKYYVKRCTIAIGVSSFLVDELVSMGARATALLYNGVDTNLFKPVFNERVQSLRGDSYPVLLFVGSLQPVRGLENIILSLSALRVKYPRIKFMIVGHSVGQYRKQLEELCKNVGVSDCTVFYGYVKHTDLPVFYNACDVFVFPSLTYQISMGVIEALACGKPVVLRDNDADAAQLEKLGVCVTFGKRRRFEEALEQALKLGSRLKIAEDLAKNFDWKIHAKRLRQIYEIALKIKA